MTHIISPPSPTPLVSLSLQLYTLGQNRELLVTVASEDASNPDAAVTIGLTTTLPEGGELWGPCRRAAVERPLLPAVCLPAVERPLLTCCAFPPHALLPAAVLHWGTREAGRGSDWLQPPFKFLPPDSTLPQGGKSAETVFQPCHGARAGQPAHCLACLMALWSRRLPAVLPPSRLPLPPRCPLCACRRARGLADGRL